MDAPGNRPPTLAYTVVTPTCNEVANLERLSSALRAQTLAPERWVIVDTGSTDRTIAVAEQLGATHPWIVVRRLELGVEAVRGGPIVRAFHDGLDAVPASSDLIVKLDADISFEPDHFARLAAEFARDPDLGIAGGIGYEAHRDGTWRQRHGTGADVWGAARAYRRECLDAILPLEERMGWDTIDLISATVRGWHTRAFSDLPFLHHRVEGVRDRSGFARWVNQGRAAHYMGYRVSYLLVRTLYRAVRDPSALGIAYGYLAAAATREARCADREVLRFVRREQSVARLPHRIRQAVRPRRALERVSVSR